MLNSPNPSRRLSPEGLSALRRLLRFRRKRRRYDGTKLKDPAKFLAFGRDVAFIWAQWCRPRWLSATAVYSGNVFAGQATQRNAMLRLLDGMPLKSSEGTWVVPPEKPYCVPVRSAILRALVILTKTEAATRRIAQGAIDETHPRRTILEFAAAAGGDLEAVTRAPAGWPALGRCMASLQEELGRARKKDRAHRLPPLLCTAVMFIEHELVPALALTAECARLRMKPFPDLAPNTLRPRLDFFEPDRQLLERRRTWWLRLATKAERVYGGQTPTAARAKSDEAADKGTGAESATHSSDFTTVNWYGRSYAFTKTQAAVVSLLWQEWSSCNGSMAESVIGDRIRPNQPGLFRLRDIFRSGGVRHEAFGTMIKHLRKGIFALCPGKTQERPS